MKANDMATLLIRCLLTITFPIWALPWVLYQMAGEILHWEEKEKRITKAMNTQEPKPAQPRPRTCSTCAHKSWDTCMAAGEMLVIARKYPTTCGRDFSAWTQREPLLTRIKAWIYAS